MKHNSAEDLRVPFNILRTETTTCHVRTHLGN